jgi:hypothetical protein
MFLPWAMPSEQIHFVITHPFYFLSVLFNTLFENKNFYIETCLGKLGWFNSISSFGKLGNGENMPIPSFFIYVILFSVIFTALAEFVPKNFTFKNKGLLFITAIAIYFLIGISLYAYWYPVSNYHRRNSG